MPRSPSVQKRHEWEKRLCKQKESGLSISLWCKRQKISKTLFFYWKARLKPPIERSSFKELPERLSSSGIAIERSGFHVSIEKGFDPSTLMQCLQLISKGF